jgi:class 3 adenylate cyclase
MIADFPELAREWERLYGVRPGLGIGIAGGEVVAGNVGYPEYMNFKAIADVVNVASRLKVRTRAGEILFTPAIMDRPARFGTGTIALRRCH